MRSSSAYLNIITTHSNFKQMSADDLQVLLPSGTHGVAARKLKCTGSDVFLGLTTLVLIHVVIKEPQNQHKANGAQHNARNGACIES